MAYNLDLMRAVREQITKHPETHDQTSWGERTKCGTTHCIAGWACALNGDTIQWEPDESVGESASSVTTKDGQLPIDDRARELLGLDDFEASDLFYAFTRTHALARLGALIEKGERAA